jgi:hypothetical protein
MLTRHTKLNLLVPPGLSDRIFPWGVHLIRGYIQEKDTSIAVEIADLRSKHLVHVFRRQYGELISLCMSALEDRQTQIIGNCGIDSLDLYFYFLACSEDRLIEIAKRNGLFKSKISGWLYQSVAPQDLCVLKRKLQTTLKAAIAKCLHDVEGTGYRDRVWGISVFDGTIFNALAVAQTIREMDPNVPIILGGDYMRLKYAVEIVNRLAWIDGVVVGCGEAVLLSVIHKYRQGVPVREMRIPGLVTSRFHCVEDRPLDGAALTRLTKSSTVTAHYCQNNANRAATFVQRQGKGIRILSQLGCDWGKCTFCSGGHKAVSVCRFSRGALVEHVGCLLKKIAEEPAGHVEDAQLLPWKLPETYIPLVLDGYDNDPRFIIELLHKCEEIDLGVRKVYLAAYLQIKRFSLKLGDALFRSQEKMKAVLYCSLESVNASVLLSMKKGHHELMGLFVGKAIQDTGHCWATGYMERFPRTDPGSVADEARILKQAFHLFCPPRCICGLTEYLPSEIDEIAQHPESYDLEISPIASDVWLKELFGVNLPFCHWAFDWRERPVRGRYGLILSAQKRYLQEKRSLGYFTTMLRACAPAERRPFWVLWHLLRQRTMVEASLLVLRLLHFGMKNKGISARSRYLNRLGKTTVNSGKKRTVPSLRIEGDVLYKFDGALGGKNHLVKVLTPEELRLLRYLYEVRPYSKVLEEFSGSLGNETTTRLMAIHFHLGSIVQSRDMVLCLAHDPGYWQERAKQYH